MVYQGKRAVRRKNRECPVRGTKAKEVQRKMMTHLADGIWKGFLENLPYEDGQSGGDDISCKANGKGKTQKMEHMSRG